jgi:hypothetical protein
MLTQLDHVLCHCSNTVHKCYSFKKLINVRLISDTGSFRLIIQPTLTSHHFEYQLTVNRCMRLLCFFITLEHFITLII